MNRSRSKFWCEPCDYVTKSLGSAACPLCRQPMRNMGTKWRVGRKGHREDWYSTTPEWWWSWLGSTGKVFEMKLNGELKWDKKRGAWIR